MESSSSFSGSSKRAKAHANIAHCLVDGCNADLSLCRDYHRRHKVCELHSKTPTVTIAGREQRFCQQCSRFHSLVEFDEGKRSCRKRLDGHNRRRRKPQSDRNSGPDFSNRRGGASFTAPPQILPSAVVGFSWAADLGPLCNNQQQQLNYVEAPTSFPMYSEGLNPVADSDGALSLLSSGSPVMAHGPSLVQYGHQYEELGQESSKPPVVSSTDSHSHGSTCTLHFPEMFQHGSSTTGSHQTLSFMWE